MTKSRVVLAACLVLLSACAGRPASWPSASPDFSAAARC